MRLGHEIIANGLNRKYVVVSLIKKKKKIWARSRVKFGHEIILTDQKQEVDTSLCENS